MNEIEIRDRFNELSQETLNGDQRSRIIDSIIKNPSDIYNLEENSNEFEILKWTKILQMDIRSGNESARRINDILEMFMQAKSIQFHRKNSESNLEVSKQMRWATWIIAGSTVINLIFTILNLFKS